MPEQVAPVVSGRRRWVYGKRLESSSGYQSSNSTKGFRVVEEADSLDVDAWPVVACVETVEEAARMCAGHSAALEAKPRRTRKAKAPAAPAAS